MTPAGAAISAARNLKNGKKGYNHSNNRSKFLSFSDRYAKRVCHVNAGYVRTIDRIIWKSPLFPLFSLANAACFSIAPGPDWVKAGGFFWYGSVGE
jgi:hypothetical protein